MLNIVSAGQYVIQFADCLCHPGIVSALGFSGLVAVNAQMSDNRHQIGAQAVGMYRRNGVPHTHQRIVAAFLCVLLIGQDIKRDLAAKSAVFALYDRECRFIAFG